MHLSPLARHALFFVGFLSTCLSFLSSPSVVWGLCALVLAPLVCLQLRRVCVHFCQLCVSALHVVGFVCPCFVSPVCLLCCGIYVFLFRVPWPALCATRVVCTAQVCMPLSLSLSLHPGLPFALRGLFALQGFLCHATLEALSVPEGLYVLERLVCLPTLSSLSPPSTWGHSL